MRPFDGDWYTQAKKETDTHIERALASRSVLGVKLHFGTVVVSEQVLAYQRKRIADHEAIDLSALDLPRTSFATQALWYELDPADDDLGTLHAAEHSQIAVLPLLAMCDRWDIGGLSTNWHPQTGVPTIFIYDGHPGGIGITRRGFEAFEQLVGDAYRLVSECPCESGCPSCVQSPKCGNLNEPLSKDGCAELMGRMLRLPGASPGLQLGQRVDRRGGLRRPPAVDPDLEVQVRAGGGAGGADRADPLAGGDRGVLGHGDRAGLEVHEDVVAAVVAARPRRSGRRRRPGRRSSARRRRPA